MHSFKKYFQNRSTAQPVPEHTTKDKIRAFSSIVSILAQIQQGPPFQDNELANKNPPNRDELLHLKLSNAFALLAVTDTGVVATTLYNPAELSVMAWIQEDNPGDQDKAAQDTQKEPESRPISTSLWDKICLLFAFNTRNDAMRPGSNYNGPCIVKATPPTNYPKTQSDPATLLQYLDDFPKKWQAPDDVSHLWVLAKMLTTLKSQPDLLLRLMKYVTAASHPKIKRRFATPKSTEYWRCFSSVKVEDMRSPTVQIASKRKRFQTEVQNDLKFLVILEKGKIIPDYKERFPDIAIIVKELPSFKNETSPDVTAHCATTFELFSGTTYKQYHLLFMALMNQYRALVDEIATTAKKVEPFEDYLCRAVEIGHALLTMVKGRAFYLYLSTIVTELLSNYSSGSNQIESAGGSQIEPEEDETEPDTTLWDPVEAATTDVWKPFKAWVMLMLVQLDAADALCAFVKRVELRNAEVDIKLVYSPLVSDKTIPLEELLTKYIPEAPVTDPKTNAKLLDFVKTAKALPKQVEYVSSLKNNWDPKHTSAAMEFLQQVLVEAKKEHEEDSQQRNGGVNPNQAISELSSEIMELLSQNAHTDIPAKLTVLEVNLKERCDKYKLPFTEKTTFRGALHCEAGLASILDKTTRENIQTQIKTLEQADRKLQDSDKQLYQSLSQLLEDSQKFTRVIGVSKHCCPVCRRFLAYLSLNGDTTISGIVTPGFHNTITSCTLPEWTPQLWVDGMNSTFGLLLRNELVKLSDAVRLRSYRSRRQSSGSGVSVGNSDTVAVVGDI